MTDTGPVGPYGPVGVNGKPVTFKASIDPTSAVASHKVIVSIGVLLVVAVIMTQVAGINKDWATVIGLILLGLLLQRFMIAAPNTTQFANSTPFIP